MLPLLFSGQADALSKQHFLHILILFYSINGKFKEDLDGGFHERFSSYNLINKKSPDDKKLVNYTLTNISPDSKKLKGVSYSPTLQHDS